MTVKLPENWNGTFFEEEASEIANMTAEEFAESLMKNNPEDAKFFLAGAIFDFQWHGLTEKAVELIKVATEKFEAPYGKIPAMVTFGKKEVQSGKDEKEIKSMFYQLIGEMFADNVGTIAVLNLRICDIGMSCDEYTTLVIAGPFRKDLPESVRERMEQHEKACSYHQSEIFHQSVIGTQVTKDLEQAAKEIIEKYSE